MPHGLCLRTHRGRRMCAASCHPLSSDRSCSHALALRAQFIVNPTAFLLPGPERSEEGAAYGAPQVRAASGHSHQERLGGSLQSRPAAVPGRALAPPQARASSSGFCRKHILSVPYKSVTLKVRVFFNPVLQAITHFRLSSRLGVQTMVTLRSGQSWGLPMASPSRHRRPRHRPR